MEGICRDESEVISAAYTIMSYTNVNCQSAHNFDVICFFIFRSQPLNIYFAPVEKLSVSAIFSNEFPGYINKTHPFDLLKNYS